MRFYAALLALGILSCDRPAVEKHYRGETANYNCYVIHVDRSKKEPPFNGVFYEFNAEAKIPETRPLRVSGSFREESGISPHSIIDNSDPDSEASNVKSFWAATERERRTAFRIAQECMDTALKQKPYLVSTY